ncbi:MAG: hypothetical protein AB7I06_02470 [Burkholderiales bacterium]
MMAVSLIEATKSLLSGTSLAWNKFEDHKAGSVTLKTPAARRLFHFLLKQNSTKVAEADESLFSGLIAAWKDENSDPASAVEQASGVLSGGSWRLKRVEASCFGGLTTLKGPTFDVWIGGENWCLEGQNGSGKTSLASAMLWALTGKRIREQDGLVDDDGQRQPVFNDKGTQIGAWPPLASYPSTVQELRADVEVWVRLTFNNETGDTAIAFRKVESSAVDDPTTEASVDARLLTAPQLVETGLLMPARLPRIGFGEKSQSLYEAVKLLTGLDQLADMADGAARLTHRGQRFLKYAKDQGIDHQKSKFDENIVKATAKSQEVNIDISKLKVLGQKDLVKDLRDTAKAASDKAGTNLATLKTEIAPGIDTAKPDARAKIKRAVATARALIEQGTKGIAEFEAWAALKSSSEDQQFQNLPSSIASAKTSLQEAIAWHRRQIDDQKLRLKALAAQFFVVPQHNHVASACPLCEGKLTTEQQKSLAIELAELKKNAEAAERKIEDVCSAIEKALRGRLSSELRKHFELLASMDPKEAYASAAMARFSIEAPFSDVLTGIAALTRDVVAKQKSVLPTFEYPTAPAEIPGEPKSAGELRLFVHSAERLVSLVEWWTKNRQAFRDAWTELVGKRDDQDKWPAKSIEGCLEVLEQAVDKAEPLDELSKCLTAAADAADAWEKIQGHQRVREEIAENLEPLKELRGLVGAETASSIASLAGRIKTILDRIHLQERLAYENASLAKKAVHVEGSFEPGMKIDAALVANTSWLRAILWAFVLALREQTIEALSANPFPLVVLDDPQTTFDPRNKRKWAQELARIANADPNKKDGMQLVLTTHERQFSQCLMHQEQLRAQQGLIAALNKVTGVSTIVNGGCLTRAYNEATTKNDDALGHKYVSDVRIYCEDLLKFMLRAEGPTISNMSLDKLKGELKRLREAHVAPFNRKPFEDLLNTLGGGGGKPMKLINDAHHKFDGTIGVAQAADVQEFWVKTLQDQIHTTFHLYADFEAHLGEPRTFAWETNVVKLPLSQSAEVKELTMFQTGMAAAAKSDGRAGDGELSMEEWKTATPLKLPNHEVYQLAAGTLDPIAGIGDLLIVSNYAKVNGRDLVVTAFGKQLLARRYNETEVHPTLAVLTGQAVDPYALPQPIIVPREGVEPRKVVGTIFGWNLLPPPPKDENNEIVVLPDPTILAKLLGNARLFQVKGRSAEPIALEGQFLITQQIPFSADAIAEVEGRLVIAVDENGARYFKRLRRHAAIIVLESLNPDGTTPAELLSLDGSQGLPKLTGLLTVTGVLFELP